MQCWEMSFYYLSIICISSGVVNRDSTDLLYHLILMYYCGQLPHGWSQPASLTMKYFQRQDHLAISLTVKIIAQLFALCVDISTTLHIWYT